MAKKRNGKAENCCQKVPPKLRERRHRTIKGKRRKGWQKGLFLLCATWAQPWGLFPFLEKEKV